jgi:hypothetical protein
MWRSYQNKRNNLLIFSSRMMHSYTKDNTGKIALSTPEHRVAQVFIAGLILEQIEKTTLDRQKRPVVK